MDEIYNRGSIQNNITDLPRLEEMQYENIFKVYLDKDDFYYYNLLQTVHIPSAEELPAGMFTEYTVTYEDTLPFISHKFYSTTKLWWLICSINKIINPTQILQPGTILKIPKQEIVRTILTEINT
jgi:LysM repeat protein